MILGIDVSTLLEQQRLAHPKYTKNHKEIDPFLLFKDNGVSHIRIRIWNNPYDEKGEPYLGGTCDLNNAIELYKTLKRYNFKYFIDFHYSDFWVDPSKQFLPKAWANFTFDELNEAIYQFTKDNLLKIKETDMDVDLIQIGNETTHGMCWPLGELRHEEERKESFKKLTTLLKSGIKAAREIYPNAQIIIHLEKSYDQYCYDEYVRELKENNVDFDILGSSYYRFFHHSLKEYFACQDMVREKYGVRVMNVEFAYPFTLNDYQKESEDLNHMAVNKTTLDVSTLECPPTKEGQAEFVDKFIKTAKEHKFEGIFYWEPMWIPGPGICWASIEAQKYQKLTVKDARNEWSNQCLFDYEGEACPALEKYRL